MYSLNNSKLPKITLSIKGCLRAAGETASATITKFDWRNAIADAGILAGITFTTSLTGLQIVDVEVAKAVAGAAIAAAGQFFLVLGLKRGIVNKEVC